MTLALAQSEDWWKRSDKEITRRIALIEKDGNILHAFAPSSPPKLMSKLVMAYCDRRKESVDIQHEDRRMDKTSIYIKMDKK